MHDRLGGAQAKAALHKQITTSPSGSLHTRFVAAFLFVVISSQSLCSQEDNEEDSRPLTAEEQAAANAEFQDGVADLLGVSKDEEEGGSADENLASEEREEFIEGDSELDDSQEISPAEEQPTSNEKELGEGFEVKEGSSEDSEVEEEVPLPQREEGAVAEEDRTGVLPELPQEGTAIVAGEIYDESGTGVGNVIISVEGIERSVRTDEFGTFEFPNLPAGELTFQFDKIGFHSASQKLTIKEGQSVTLEQAMEEKPAEFEENEYELDSVEVVGEYVEEQKTEIEIEVAEIELDQGQFTSVIGEEQFAKEAVSDAAGAVGKIAGANIVDGKFAVVRGLADRYVTTTYNGGAIASSVPDRKAVELDLFPTSALIGINVEKTYAPDLSGDFGGAAIDIRTKTFPEESFFTLKSGYSYTSGLPDDFLTVDNADLGFFGDVEISFDLDSSLDFDGGFVSSGGTPVNQQRAQEIGRELFINSRSLFPDETSSEQPRSFGLSWGENFKPSDQFEWGFLINLNQGGSDDYNQTARIRPVDVSAPQTDFLEEFTRNRDWDVYLATGFKLGEEHEVGASFFRKHTGSLGVASVTDIRSPQGSEGFGSIDGLEESAGQLQRTRDSFGAFAELTGSSFAQEAIERDLEVIQLLGGHQFGERGPKLSWSYTDSDATEFRENSFLQFGVLDFGSEALIDEVNGVVSESIAEVIDNLQNPNLFVGVQVPDFANTAEAVAGLNSILAGLTIDNVSPDGGFPPQLSAEQILAVLRGTNQRSISQAEELLGGLDPDREEEVTFSIRTLSVDPGQGLPIIRGIQTVDEQVQNFRADLSFPFYFSKDNENRGFELLLGGSQIEAQRETTGLAAQLLLETTDGSLQLTPESLSAEDLALLSNAFEENGEAGFNEALFDFLTGNNVQAAQILDASVGPLDTIFDNRIASNSSTSRDIESHYIGGRFFWDDFFLRGGLRFESEERQGDILNPQPDTGINFPGFSASEVLPSVSFGSSFFDDRLTVLGAWSQTVARPTFFEFVPIVSQDFASNTIRQGNADLDNTQITNFDFSAALRFGEASLFRASFFHKVLQDPIVARRQPEFPSAITFINGDSGVISGVELELDFLEFRPWTISANVTFIDASLQFDGGLGSGALVETQFPFQPSFISNLNFGYESVEGDWGVNLIFNFTGEQNTLLPASVESPTQQQRPLLGLDLVARKKFDWGSYGEFSLSAGVTNLIANDREEVFVGGGDGAQALSGLVAQSEQRLRTFYISGSLEF